MKNKLNKLKLLILILSLMVTFTAFFQESLPSFAQSTNTTSTSIGVYPPIMQMDTTPPANPRADFFLTNPSDQSLTLNISYKPFRPKNTKDGQIELIEDLSSFPDPLFVNRIKVLENDGAVKTITLSPKQNKKLTFEVQIPVNMQKGDYYFTILFSARPTSNIKTNSSLLFPTIGINVLLTVGPKGKTLGTISKFQAPKFVDSGPVVFKVEVANRSDHFFAPEGEIVIKNMLGRKTGKIKLMPVNILASSVRAIPDINQANVDSKEYEEIESIVEKQDSPVAIFPKKLMLGFYTATLNLSLEENGPTFSKTIWFFAFPLSYLLAIFIILGVTVFIILRVKKKIS